MSALRRKRTWSETDALLRMPDLEHLSFKKTFSLSQDPHVTRILPSGFADAWLHVVRKTKRYDYWGPPL
jgi:hypothetical protein